MPLYIRKHTEVWASQWFKNGDHIDVKPLTGFKDGSVCSLCEKEYNFAHGTIRMENGSSLIVCPGQFVFLKDSEYRTMNEREFLDKYEQDLYL